MLLLSVVVAGVSLIAGLALFLYTARSATRNQHSSLLIAWLLIALTPVFLVFTFFPSSNASGTVQGFTLGGAIAAFVFIWMYGSRKSMQLRSADQLERELDRERDRVQELQREIHRLSAEQGPVVLAEQAVFKYRVAKRKSRRIGLITGSLLNVDFVDLWVNSENTNMQMSRFHEGTVSAVIRYNGARRDENGIVLEDTIANELHAKLGGALSVEPATVIATSAGELSRTNNVKSILHVAAVSGEPGIGYIRVSDIARCVTAALDMAEQIDTIPSPRSVVFPLLGTGSGKAGLEPTARLLLIAALSWLASDRSRNITTVYFLAYRDSELHTCQKLLADSGAVTGDKASAT